jgi:chromosome segregation ATPase
MEEPGNSAINVRAENPALDLTEKSTKEALRIQAAAVAAQQAALTEEELRLEQRWRALEQQERQLGAYFEQQRQGLDALRADARQAQQALQQDRAAFEQRVATALEQITAQRQDVGRERSGLVQERRKLIDLRRRMIQRWRRHWSRERAELESKQVALNQARQHVEKSERRLQQEKEALATAWARANTNLESKHKELKKAQASLHAAERKLTAMTRELTEREANLKAGTRQLAADRVSWEAQREKLADEIEGLESRARNARNKLLALEKRHPPATAAGTPSAPAAIGSLQPEPDAAFSTFCGMLDPHAMVRDQVQNEDIGRLIEELSDQRMFLAEECLRLAMVHKDWQNQEQRLGGELEALAHRIEQHELVLAQREQELKRREQHLEEQAQENDHAFGQVETIKVHLSSHVLALETEKNRLLHDLTDRRRQYEEEWQAALELRQRWENRRDQQVRRLRSQMQGLAELGKELAGLRREMIERRAQLDLERRQLAERSLSLEQLRQEYLAKAEDPVAAEKRFNVLLQQWSDEAATIESTFSKERRAIESYLGRFEERLQLLCRYHEELADRETALTRRETAWQEKIATEQGERNRLTRELALLRNQRDSYLEQNRHLRDDVDKLAHLLLESEDDRGQSAQAA